MSDMRSVKAVPGYKEYLIEYDTEARFIWASGLTVEGFWEDLYFDAPNDMDKALKEMKARFPTADVLDITNISEEFVDWSLD